MCCSVPLNVMLVSSFIFEMPYAEKYFTLLSDNCFSKEQLSKTLLEKERVFWGKMTEVSKLSFWKAPSKSMTFSGNLICFKPEWAKAKARIESVFSGKTKLSRCV